MSRAVGLTPGPWQADYGTEGYFFLTHSDGLELPQTRENLAMLGAGPDLYAALSAILAAKRDVDTYTRGGQMSAMLMDPKEIRARADAAFIAGEAALAKASPTARSLECGE